MIDVSCIFDVMRVSVGMTIGMTIGVTVDVAVLVAWVSVAVRAMVAIVNPALIRMLIDVDVVVVVPNSSLIGSTIIVALTLAVRLMVIKPRPAIIVIPPIVVSAID